MLRLWWYTFIEESGRHVFHQHSAWISGVSMTTVHSVMTTEEPPMARRTPWLPVGFLLRLSLLPWIQNHPLASLSFSAGSRPQFLTCLAESRHTNTFRDSSMHSQTCKHNPYINKSVHVYLYTRIWALEQRFTVYIYLCICQWGTTLSAHPKISIEMCSHLITTSIVSKWQ